MANKYEFTAETLKKMKEKLQDLRSNGRTQVAEKIKEARSFGDLSENAEYDAAKAEQAKLETEISELEDLVQHAVVIDESSYAPDEIRVGSRVRLYDATFDEEDDYTVISGSSALNNSFDATVISGDSPIGKAIMGHKPGDELHVMTPGGESIIKVIEVNND